MKRLTTRLSVFLCSGIVGLFWSSSLIAAERTKQTQKTVTHQINNQTRYHAEPSKYFTPKRSKAPTQYIDPNTPGKILFDIAHCDKKNPQKDLYSKIAFDFIKKENNRKSIVDTCAITVTSICKQTPDGIDKKIAHAIGDCMRDVLKIKHDKQNKQWIVTE